MKKQEFVLEEKGHKGKQAILDKYWKEKEDHAWWQSYEGAN